MIEVDFDELVAYARSLESKLHQANQNIETLRSAAIYMLNSGHDEWYIHTDREGRSGLEAALRGAPKVEIGKRLLRG